MFLRVLLFPFLTGGSESPGLVEGFLFEGTEGSVRRIGDAEREEMGEGEGVPSGDRGP